MRLEAILLLFPLAVSFIYKEGTYLSYIIPIGALILISIFFGVKKPEKSTIYAKEGFIIVGFSWIIMALFGALPFVISGQIPNYIDAVFETSSGLSTTGSSILTNVEALSKSMLFWRSFTHWIGGMGVLVFILAIMPLSDARSIYILRAESPGPQVGKLVSRVKVTARILYLIYIALTILQIIFLSFGDMDFYEAVVHSIATAGTGGFAIKNTGLACYSAYSQIVITIFMVLFGINFNIFYFLLIGNFKQIFKNEEFKYYIGIYATASLIIALNLFFTMGNVMDNLAGLNINYGNFGTSLKHSCFQVATVMTTTGFSTADFNSWPMLSKTILGLLMFVGASAGSTGGGIKVSRFVIAFKSVIRNIKKLLHPNSVESIKFDGKLLDEDVVRGTNNYFITIAAIFIVCLFLISFDKGGDFETNFTAVTACLNNIGPGFGKVGAAGNYAFYSYFSKIVLTFAMLIGRLEIYPILLLFYPKTYIRR